MRESALAPIRLGLRVWRRAVLSEPTLALIITVMTLLLSFLVMLGLRLSDQASAQDLSDTLAQGPPENRSIRFDTDHRIGAGGSADPFRPLIRHGARLKTQDIPEAIQDLFTDEQAVIQSPPFKVRSFPDELKGPFDIFFRFRHQIGIEQEMELVAGRLPQPRDSIEMLVGGDCPSERLAVTGFERQPDVDCWIQRVPVHETVLTADTAQDMMVSVGDQVILQPDESHRLWAFARPEHLQRRIVLSISGIVALSARADEFWYDDSSLHHPRISENADFRIVEAFGIFHAPGFRALFRDIPDTHFEYSWRFLIDPDQVDPAQAALLGSTVDQVAPSTVRVSTNISASINQHLAQRRLTLTLLSLGFVAAVVLAGVALSSLGSLAVQRQEPAVHLLLGRGATIAGIWLMGLIHALTTVVPGVLIGSAAAYSLAPTGGPMRAGGLAALIGMGAALVVMASTLTVTSSWHRTSTSLGEAGGLKALRQWVRDLVAVVLGLAAIGLLRRRTASNAEIIDPGVDMLLAVTPILVAVAGAVVIARLIPPLGRLLATTIRYRQGLVAFVGFRRLATSVASARGPILVLVTAIGIAGLSVSIRTTISDAQDRQGWLTTGADVAVRNQTDGATLPSGLVEAMKPLGDVVTVGTEFPSVLVLSPGAGLHIDLLAIDAPAHRTLLAKAPINDSALDALAPPPIFSGEPSPVRAVISRHWPGVGSSGQSDRPQVGDEIRLNLDGHPTTLVVGAIVEQFPTLAAPFVVVDSAQLAPSLEPRPVNPTVVYLTDPVVSSETVLATAREQLAGASFTVRHQIMDEMGSDPFNWLIDRGLIVLTGLVATLGLAALVSALALSGRSRQRDLGLLATMGLTWRQGLGITMIEQLTPTAIAVVGGGALAYGLGWLLAPALDLAAFAAANDVGAAEVEEAAVTINKSALAAIVTAIMVTASAGVAMAARVGRRGGHRVIISRGEF